MGSYEPYVVDGEDDFYVGRRRGPAGYRSYLPQKLADLQFTTTAETMAAVDSAASATARVDEMIHARGMTGILSVLSKSESISSSLIEDLQSSTHTVVLALGGDRSASDAVKSIINNVRITERAVARFADLRHDVAVSDIVELQADLVTFTSRGRVMGRELTGVKRVQNRIGGRSLRDADYVPPPPHLMSEYLDDLVLYVNHHEQTSSIVAAAFAHAQFETLHPFVDGNGRTGRAIVQGMLRRDGVTRHCILPLSTSFAADQAAYLRGLTSFQKEGALDQGRLNDWVQTFAFALEQAAVRAGHAADRLQQLRRSWLATLGETRATTAVARMIDAVLQNLTVTAESGAELLGVSGETSRNALRMLEEKGFVVSRTRSRTRVFYSPVMIDVIDGVDGVDEDSSVDEVDGSAGLRAPRSAAEEVDGGHRQLYHVADRCGSSLPRSRRPCIRRAGHSGAHRAA